MRIGRKILAVVLVLLALAGVFGGCWLSTLDGRIQRDIERSASESLGVPVTLRSLDVSLLGARARVRGFSAANPPGFATARAIRAESFFAEFELRSVFRAVADVPEIRIRGLEFTVEGSLKGSNLAAIARNARKAAEAGERRRSADGEPPPREPLYRVDRLTALNTTVRLSATFMGGREASYTIPSIELTDLPEEATAGEIFGRLVEAVMHQTARAPGKIGQLFAELGAQAGLGLVEKTLDGAGTAAREVGAGMGQVSRDVGAGIGQGIVGVADGVGEVGGGTARGAGGTVEGVGKGVGDAVHRVGSGIGAVGGGILKGTAEIIKGLGNGAVGAVETVGEICKPEPEESRKKGDGQTPAAAPAPSAPPAEPRK